jgi:ferredoxin like protein
VRAYDTGTPARDGTITYGAFSSVGGLVPLVSVVDKIRDRVGLEKKLSINSYSVDPARAHIRIIDHHVCLQCERQQCINCCPAACYAPQPDGTVLFSYEGCVECGTCRIVCNEFGNIEWTYPRGGFGIQYRFG